MEGIARYSENYIVFEAGAEKRIFTTGGRRIVKRAEDTEVFEIDTEVGAGNELGVPLLERLNSRIRQY